MLISAAARNNDFIIPKELSIEDLVIAFGGGGEIVCCGEFHDIVGFFIYSGNNRACLSTRNADAISSGEIMMIFMVILAGVKANLQTVLKVESMKTYVEASSST